MAPETIWTVSAALSWTEHYLQQKGCENPRASAQWLLMHATGLSRTELYTQFDKPLSLHERDVLRRGVARRATGEPLQYITGRAPFRYLNLRVAPGVLIPRPETEVLVSEAMAELKLPSQVSHVRENDEGEEVVAAEQAPVRIIDVCCGSGCIACSIASEYAQAQVLALDIDAAALSLTRENIEELHLGGQVTVRESNLLATLSAAESETFDAVISNPPYVPTEVLQGLSREVNEFEPALALDGGPDGLRLYRELLPQAFACLKPGGVLAVELFETTLVTASELAARAGFVAVRIAHDLTGRPRVLLAHKPAS